MNKILPIMACSAVLLGGCMYGNSSAPITALGNQQPGRAPVGQIHVNSGQAVALTPTRVAPSPQRPVAVQQPPVAVRPPQPQDNIVVQQQSPYGQPAVAQPYQPQNNADDGWSVAPGQQPARQEPPAVGRVPVENANTDVAESRPVRPQAARPVENAENTRPESGNNNDSGSNASATQQVASATPPQQPAAPEKGETAVSALLKKASASLGKGDLDGAAAYLENAQRIEPQNVKILYDIANIRYHQGRYKDAETFAGRAVQAGGSNSMMKKSWALIANARKSLGDNQGAIAAAENAASY